MVEETLIERANKMYGNGDNDGRWKYDWCRPVKPVENSHGSEISDPLAGISSENKETSYYSFRFKTWMRDTSEGAKEQDPPVLLNLDQYDRLKIAQAKKKKSNNGDDLSEDAIRGAVGGSDSVFSSSHSKPETATNKKPEEAQENNTTKSESEAVVPAEKASPAAQEENKQAPSDENKDTPLEENKDTLPDDSNATQLEENKEVPVESNSETLTEGDQHEVKEGTEVENKEENTNTHTENTEKPEATEGQEEQKVEEVPPAQEAASEVNEDIEMKDA